MSRRPLLHTCLAGSLALVMATGCKATQPAATSAAVTAPTSTSAQSPPAAAPLTNQAAPTAATAPAVAPAAAAAAVSTPTAATGAFVAGNATLDNVAFTGASVTAYSLGQTVSIATGTTDASGNFKVDLPSRFAGTAIKIVATKGGKTLATVAQANAAPAAYHIAATAEQAQLTLASTLALLMLAPRFQATAQATTLANGSVLLAPLLNMLAVFVQITAAAALALANPANASVATAVATALTTGGTGTLDSATAAKLNSATPSLGAAFTAAGATLNQIISAGTVAGGQVPSAALLGNLAFGDVNVVAVLTGITNAAAVLGNTGSTDAGGGTGGTTSVVTAPTATGPAQVSVTGNLAQATVATPPPNPAPGGILPKILLKIDGVLTPVAPGYRHDIPGGSWVFGREGSAVVVGDVGVAITLSALGSGVYTYGFTILDARASLTNAKFYPAIGGFTSATSPGQVTSRTGAFDFVDTETLKDTANVLSHVFEVTATLPQL
jgi:hypothetical protein